MFYMPDVKTLQLLQPTSSPIINMQQTHRVTVTSFQCQLAFAAILWVKLLEKFFTVISLKYTSVVKLVIK